MPSLQTIIVLVIVAGAAFYLIRRFSRKLKKPDKSSCGCGCASCDASRSCTGNQP